jgi:threonine synthase
VIVATASPYKFAADVLNALTGDNAGGDPFAASEKIQALTGIPMPEQVIRLRDLPIRHTTECFKDRMGQAVLDVMA